MNFNQCGKSRKVTRKSIKSCFVRRMQHMYGYAFSIILMVAQCWPGADRDHNLRVAKRLLNTSSFVGVGLDEMELTK